MATLRAVLDALTRAGSVSLPLPDFAAIALATNDGRPISVGEIGPALGRLGLKTGSFAGHRPSDFAEPGRIKVVSGRLEPLVSVDVPTLLAPILEHLRAPRSPTLPFAPPRPPPRPPPRSKPAPPKPPPPKPPPPKPPPPRVAPRRAPPEPPVPPPPALVPAAVRWEPLSPEAAAAALAAHVESAAAFTWCLDAHQLGVTDRFDELLAPARMTGVEPHTYQTETVRRVLRQFRGRTLLADEVGLGKTVEAMMILREYQLRGMVRRALVLVPPALVGQWAEELRSKAGVEPVVVSDPDEATWRREGVVLASVALARSARHAPNVQAVGWDLVIVDEAHHLKNRNTLAFKLVDGLKSRFLLLLTATPVENDLVELYNLVTLLKPGQLSTLADFKRRFADGKDPTAARDVPRLRGLLAEVMVRNTRASSGLSLPPRYVTTVATEPTRDERALYDEVVALFRAHRGAPGARRLADTLLLEAGSSAAAVRGSLARFNTELPDLAAGLDHLRTLAGRVRRSAKGKALLDLFGAHQEKVLVFTRFRDTLDEVRDLAREAGIEAALVHGGMDRTRKHAEIQRFKDQVPLLLCTDVGSEGHNLQFCHVLVNYDLPWNPMVIEQRIGRLHRYGQAEPVRVYNLCARGTAEERLLDVLDRRVHLFELVVGEMDLVLGNVVEQADLEERVLSIYARARSEDDLGRAFDDIADELARARGQHDRVKELDDALFGRELET